ncbi:MAG: carboxypeptidase regulatory-like domain-containing protein [Bacteroidetes bacterium]|nr:MAG: carboxypeptidase regulatory-like domain-containing protein [Bacteroidota bacterium]
MNRIQHLNKLIIVFLFAALIAGIGCQQEIKEVPGSTPNPNPGTETPVNDNEMVTASVLGVVVNENNIPVQGAIVKSGTNTTTTDVHGIFRFSNISLSKANGKVKVEQNGYFTAYRTFVTTAGRTHNVRIQLLPKTNTGNFAAPAGGTINLPGGAKLVVPVAAVTDAGGAAYNGTVNVAMTWIDPTAANLGSIVMGDLRGITTSGVERGLTTYGMLGVELTGGGGQPLKIASGKTAELTFPIPAALGSSAPATIDLWHFDEATARWKQEGTATKTGSNYIANVSHFSFWNCDAQFPLIDLCMTLVKGPENGPLSNAPVRIKRTVNNSYGYGRTDSAGRLCGKVPKNESLVLEVLDQCNIVAYSQNIGPFASNTDLGTIVVTLPTVNTLTITGNAVNCSGGNVTSGVAFAYLGGGNVYSAAISNGQFVINIVRCNNSGTLNLSVQAIDYATLQQSNPVLVTGTTGTVNAGTLQACGASAVEFVDVMVDGTPTVYTAPPDSITAHAQGGTRGVNAMKIITPGTVSYVSFTYTDITSPGTTPLLTCFVQGPNSTQQIITTPSPVVNITAVGPVMTGFIEGNFSIQMTIGGTPRTVSCNFRVRRF